MSYFVDPFLLESWLRARSLSRGLPQPVADSGGLRVDSGLPNETRRTHSCIFSAAGELAASGHAARYGDVFIYDRILTVEGHRRKGLGTIIMTALASARPAATSIQILV
ncbi:MAG TPA: hypothetical protein VKR31_14740, partial [Rhizomicrobium sp.]|nr:hypothetical protein [Rhizomicrobium sp.]